MNEIDMDAYNSSEDKIKPGKHEEFTIHPTVHSFQEYTAQPDVEDIGMGKKSGGMVNETGWMMNPTFEERFSGAQPMPETPPMDPNALEGNWIQHGRATPKGWHPNPFPQHSPSMDDTTESQKQWKRQGGQQFVDPNHYPSLLWQQKPNVFPNASGPMTMPFDPNTPEVYNFPIADVENSIESLAQKHGVEGSKMKDIITDVLKNPTNYISPMPGEMGMAKVGRPPTNLNIGEFKRLFETGMGLDQIAKELGVTDRTLLEMRRRAGLAIAPTTTPEKNVLYPRGQPKITINPDDLRADLDQGMSKTEMADKYKISKPTLEKRLKEMVR